MKVILVPGLFSSVEYLSPLQSRLEEEGHECVPGLRGTNLVIQGELTELLETLESTGPAALVGHSAGGLLSIILAQARHPFVKLVIGLGSAITGSVDVRVPVFEARSLHGWWLPIMGVNEVKRFWVPHFWLPSSKEVQSWVVEKLNERA